MYQDTTSNISVRTRLSGGSKRSQCSGMEGSAVECGGGSSSVMGCSVVDGGGRFSYNKLSFKLFVDSLSRLFCEDEEIIVLDLLLEEERAYTERDMAERLLWPDKKIREVCLSLEKQLLLLKDNFVGSPAITSGAGFVYGTNSSGTSTGISNRNSTGIFNGINGCTTGRTMLEFGSSNSKHTMRSGSNLGGNSIIGFNNGPVPIAGISAPGTTSFWYINPNLAAVARWRCDKLFGALLTKRQLAEKRDAFQCTRCHREYDGLEAQMLYLDPVDATFLCKFCGTRLEQEDNKKLQESIECLQRRAENSLALLRKNLDRIWNMQIPKYQPFTRADKNELKRMTAATVVPSGNYMANIDKECPNNEEGALSMATNLPPVNSSTTNTGNTVRNAIVESKDINFSNEKDNSNSVVSDNSTVTKTKVPVKFSMKVSVSNHMKNKKLNLVNRTACTKQVSKIPVESNEKKTKNDDTKIKLNSTKDIKSNDIQDLSQQVVQNLSPQSSTNSTNKVDATKDVIPDIDSVSTKTIFISKYSKAFTLLEAQHMQQEMDEAEFLEFSELQDAYLNIF